MALPSRILEFTWRDISKSIWNNRRRKKDGIINKAFIKEVGLVLHLEREAERRWVKKEQRHRNLVLYHREEDCLRRRVYLLWGGGRQSHRAA